MRVLTRTIWLIALLGSGMPAGAVSCLGVTIHHAQGVSPVLPDLRASHTLCDGGQTPSHTAETCTISGHCRTPGSMLETAIGVSPHAHAEAAETYARIAPLIAQRLRIRLSPDGGHSFPERHSRPLNPHRPQLPSKPATVYVYDEDGYGQLLVADLDVRSAPGEPFTAAAARVAEEAASMVALVERCGGRTVVDISPSGGRHVYLRWSRRMPWQELRRLARALARRYPSMDVRPMSSPAGQIRPPGALHKVQNGQLTGYLRLTVPIEEAEQILRRPCGPTVWRALHQDLTAELGAVDAAGGKIPDISAATPGIAGRTCPRCHKVLDVPLDDAGHPWLPRDGGPRDLPLHMAQLARDGRWQRLGSASPSEARLGLLNSMAAAGFRLGEVVAAVRAGTWSGLDRLLTSRRNRPRSPREAARRLRWDWRTAVLGVSQLRHDRNCHTSQRNPSTAPPPSVEGSAPVGQAEVAQPLALYNVDSLSPEADSENLWGINTVRPDIADERVLNCWQEILQWVTCIRLAERDAERNQGWGRARASIRLVLRAIAVAARMDGSTKPAFGTRSLSEMTGLDYSTVARLLRLLRAEDDPLVVLVEVGRGKAADRYQLRVPVRYRAAARWIRWRGGMIDALHPALHELGPAAALVYEALSSHPTGVCELATTAQLARSTVTEALRTLAAYQLADREAGGWIRGARPLHEVEVELGADIVKRERHARYVEHRRIWHGLLASWSEQAPQANEPVEFEATPWPTAPSDAEPVDIEDHPNVQEPDPQSWRQVPWPSSPADQGPPGEDDGYDHATNSRRLKRRWPTRVPRRGSRRSPGEQEVLFDVNGHDAA